MNFVKPKKHLGQHFLTDDNIAVKIADSVLLSADKHYSLVEIGPGTGALTQHLLKKSNIDYLGIEIDRDSVDFLLENLKLNPTQIVAGDFLKIDFQAWGTDKDWILTGNFPYNISSQIFFKALAHKNQVSQIVCMLQKEVAQRIASPPGSKEYGILSVYLQAYYHCVYLFTVSETVFFPPPKVKSGVIRLIRRENQELGCDEKLFFKVVKATFNHRRKTLRNSIKSVCSLPLESALLDLRPEQLSVQQFVELTTLVHQKLKKIDVDKQL